MAGGQEIRKSIYNEGWLEHRGGGNKKDKFTNLYIVLRKRKLYIFPNSDLESHNPMGSLSLDRFTTVKRKDKGGYRLELSTVSTQPTDGQPMTFKNNTFKSVTKLDRDLWFAFIFAVSQGSIPSNIHLSPNDKLRIEDAMQDCVKSTASNGNKDTLTRIGLQPEANTTPQRPRALLLRSNTEPSINVSPGLHPKRGLPSPSGWPDTPPPPPPGERERRPSCQSEVMVGRPLPHIPSNSSRLSALSSSSSDSASRVSGRSYGADSGTTSYDADNKDGPFMFHQFYMNRGNCDNIPTWFYENCTRDQAEMVLMLGKRYGNLLMRESTTYRQSGSYVIDAREETPRGTTIRHFEVIRVAEGFKIDLLDREHAPMSCLTEVMTFITQCMGPDCRPMSTNDRGLIGLPVPEYDRVLNRPGGSKTNSPLVSPIDDDVYTLPDNLRQSSGLGSDDEDDYADPTDLEKDYLDMRSLRQGIADAATQESHEVGGSIARPRPRPMTKPKPKLPQETYDVPPNNTNNPFFEQATSPPKSDPFQRKDSDPS